MINRETVLAWLKSLGSTKEEVIATIEALGIKDGKESRVIGCPIHRATMMHFDLTSRQVGVGHTCVNIQLPRDYFSVSVPEPIVEAIRYWDRTCPYKP